MLDPNQESINADQKHCFFYSLLVWVIFAFLDPDPQAQLHLDPDPKHWKYIGAGKDRQELGTEIPAGSVTETTRIGTDKTDRSKAQEQD